MPLASGSLPTPRQKMTRIVLEYLECLGSDDSHSIVSSGGLGISRKSRDDAMPLPR